MSASIDPETAVSVLRRASELIDSDSTWLRCISAVDSDNTPVWSVRKRAVRFCGTGAIERAVWEVSGLSLLSSGESPDLETTEFVLSVVDPLVKSVFELVQGVGDDAPIELVNDTEGREAVLALFEKAIEELVE